MDNAFIKMEESLEEFEIQRHAYNIFKKDEMEVLTNTRVVKQEVNEISETMEILTEIVQRQDQNITELRTELQLFKLKEYRDAFYQSDGPKNNDQSTQEQLHFDSRQFKHDENQTDKSSTDDKLKSLVEHQK